MVQLLPRADGGVVLLGIQRRDGIESVIVIGQDGDSFEGDGTIAEAMTDIVGVDGAGLLRAGTIISEILITLAAAAEGREVCPLGNHVVDGHLHQLFHVAAAPGAGMHRHIADADTAQLDAADDLLAGIRTDGGLETAVLDGIEGMVGRGTLGTVELGQELDKVAVAAVEAENIIDEIDIIVKLLARAAAIKNLGHRNLSLFGQIYRTG